MDKYFIIKDTTIEVFQMKKLITFSDLEFKLKVKDNSYLITGTNLELLEIDQTAEKLVISGSLSSIVKLNKVPKVKESLLKRIFH